MNCPKCDAPVMEATLLSGQKLCLDAQPDPENGQVLVLDGRATYIDGQALLQARRAGVPTYRRHNVYCPKYLLGGE